MKAIVLTKYGSPDVLELKEVEKPVPKDNQILIKVFATTVTLGDCEMRSLKLPLAFKLPIKLYFGFIKPRGFTLGQEFSGIIEEIGKGVTKFKNGEEVFGPTGIMMGAYAQYLVLPETAAITTKPKNMTFKEAAGVSVGGHEALNFIKGTNLKKGQSVLINGAGGSIGTFGIQLAKNLGARVTGVDKKEKFEVMQKVGADFCIDYQEEDFTKNGKTYDVIFDVVGKVETKRAIASLCSNGVYISSNLKLSQMLFNSFINKGSGKKAVFSTSEQSLKDLEYLRDLIEAGKLKTVIDRSYSLEHIVKAHEYVEQGLKKGNVIIAVEHETK